MQERVGFIVLGIVVAGIGVALMANGHDVNFLTGEEETNPLYWIGMLLAGFGGVLAQVGIIAVGVALGVREAPMTPAESH